MLIKPGWAWDDCDAQTSASQLTLLSNWHFFQNLDFKKKRILLSGRRRHTSTILLHKQGRKKLTFMVARKYLNILKTHF